MRSRRSRSGTRCRVAASTRFVTASVTALVRSGANLEAVRELAGHSKLLTTQRYLHASGADLRDAVSRLPGNAKPLGN